MLERQIFSTITVLICRNYFFLSRMRMTVRNILESLLEQI